MVPNELPAPTGAPTPRPTPRPHSTTASSPSDVTPAPRPGLAGTSPVPRPATAAKARPDARPMRLGLGAGAIAAITVMIGGMVRFPVSDPTVAAEDSLTADAPITQQVRVEKRIRYVQLKRGQKAPPGATVIDAAQPTPRVVVTRIQQPAKVKKVTKSRQSGR